MLVCDLDDTLYKEIDFVTSSFPVIGAELSRRGLMEADEAVRLLSASPADMRRGIDRLMARLDAEAPGCGVTPGDIVEIYRNHTPRIRLSPGVERTLAALKERGVRLGLITDGRSGTQRAKIRALGLERFFDEENILISGETGFDKFSVRPFEMMMERNPHQLHFTYIGDNPAKDFLWPNRLGWSTVMLCGGFDNLKPQYIELPKDYRAMFRITSFADVRNFC